MELESAALGFALVFLTLGAAGLLPATAQASSVLPFTLQESTPALCWFFGAGFNATSGQQFTVEWTQNPSAVNAPVSVNFYIAPLPEVYVNWLCDVGPPAYLYWNDGAYGTANWSAPSTGLYAALVVNYSQYPVSGTISVTTVNATVSVTPIGPRFVRRMLPVPCTFGCLLDALTTDIS
jgi:CubicO group peptidase (beta-lactamase class C family)